MISAALQIEQKLHCVYRPEASGMVEQINGTIKSRLSKVCAPTALKWPDALPLVLMSLRSIPDKKTGLSTHEVIMGRTMRQPIVPANQLMNITDDLVLDYCKGLADVVRCVFHLVGEVATTTQQEQAHDLSPREWVLVKKHVKKLCLEPRWHGPYQVILVTTTAVKCGGLPNWIHTSHTRRVPSPLEGTETNEGDQDQAGSQREPEQS